MDIDEQLIEEVRSREILYDLAQADYKNTKKKEYEWREVAAAMKMGEEECRKRWKGLRDSYKRCKRAEQLTQTSKLQISCLLCSCRLENNSVAATRLCLMRFCD